MMDKDTTELIYNAHEGNLSSQIDIVISVMVERGMMVAGFSSEKELLTIHYNGYKKDKPVWWVDFFEGAFNLHPLLADREKVKAVFFLSDKDLVIPETLFDRYEAKDWLKRIHHVEADDVIEYYSLSSEKANYVVALPGAITELVKSNFTRADIQPLPIYHFMGLQQQGLYLECCITSEQVCVTMHNFSQLLWHKVFSYKTAEDIAYEIRLLCNERSISPSKITLLCNTLTSAEYSVMNDLSQYFQHIKSGSVQTITGPWDGPKSLAHQLLLCVL